ncbi:rod shape-determining protein RodA [Peptoniphilus sp. KCTC 25270]|uniref:rod shape-determining protein RodA n=1 Tax=Peptoniphilus sp. KCTC 25270 TaxID=2897414 RepID=UPI001E62A04F|nr:rod shape-determining protein RodA [Peptoniphilus sp. KCTC 25270]MCD1146638.1 rod shape-determining protein RodA [Peptoniphilus sp. KCTC 25270]
MKNKRLQKFSIKKTAFLTGVSKRQVDFQLILLLIAVIALGILILSSATLTLESNSHLQTQIIATLLGMVVMFVLMYIDYRLWKKLHWLLYGISILLLVATLIFGHGDTTWGAKSWLRIGPLNFQPAEFVKIWLVLCFAGWLEDHQETLNQPIVLVKSLAYVGIPVGLILLQPDFGTAMVYLVFIAVMLFFADLDWNYIFGAIGAVLLSLPFLYARLDNYQKDRILDFMKPGENISGSGYQAYEGRIAIGNGRFFGRGLYEGTQTQNNFIPTKETDFIYPVLVEELGFVGGFLLLLLYGGIIYRMFHISQLSKDRMGKLLVLGYGSIFIVHIWENIGMTLGLMPVTGIPLPFISYGGSFQLVNLAMIGLILSVRFHRFNKKEKESNPIEEWILEKYYDIGDYFDDKLHRERVRRMKK